MGNMAEDDDQWAVIHCYATYEDLVIDKIKKRVPEAEVRRLKFPGCIAYRWDLSLSQIVTVYFHLTLKKSH